MEIDGYNISIVGIHPVSEKVNLIAKLGIFAYDIDTEFNNTDGRFSPSIELGLIYSFAEFIDLKLGYTSYRGLKEIKPEMFAIGINYLF